jgi:group II intron reverse transcriptase/maturase
MDKLLERVLERDNLFKAPAQVERNKGAAGVDGLDIEQLRPFLKENWMIIKDQLLSGRYSPKPVKVVEIPKASGGTRKLGIPSVLDRLIQQAILQVISPIFDPGFSRFSFGFRPRRSAHQAIKQAHAYLKAGYSIVVDIDLENFFNEVNHDLLMSRVARKLKDKRILKLIRSFLRSGVMIDGIIGSSPKGTPQGWCEGTAVNHRLLLDLRGSLKKAGLLFYGGLNFSSESQLPRVGSSL